VLLIRINALMIHIGISLMMAQLKPTGVYFLLNIYENFHYRQTQWPR